MQTIKGKILEHPNLAVKVYEILKNRIVNQEILSGIKLQEEVLAEELGVSRTPVREALNRLAQEGLVEMVPRRGTFVVKPSLSDIKELLEVREVLEGMAARLVATKITDEILEEMKKYFEGREQQIRGGYLEEYSKADVNFHDLLLRACGNERLVRMMNNLYDYIQMLRLRTVILPGRAEKSLKEHLMIIDALEKRDPDLAEKKIREHIRNVKIDVLKALERE